MILFQGRWLDNFTEKVSQETKRKEQQQCLVKQTSNLLFRFVELTFNSDQKLATWCVSVPRCIKCCVQTPLTISSFPMCHVSASEFVTSVMRSIIISATNSSDNVSLWTLEVHLFAQVIYIIRPYKESHIRCIIRISNVFTNHFPFSVLVMVAVYTPKFDDHLSYWVKRSHLFLCY